MCFPESKCQDTFFSFTKAYIKRLSFKISQGTARSFQANIFITLLSKELWHAGMQ